MCAILQLVSAPLNPIKLDIKLFELITKLFLLKNYLLRCCDSMNAYLDKERSC